MPDEKLIAIAEVTGAHGVRGEIVVRSYAGDPQDLVRYGELRVGESGPTLEVRSARVAGKGVILRIEGIADRNAAEALRGAVLLVARSALPATGSREFYHADLIGLAAVAADGRPIGRVSAVVNYGAGDLLEITPGGGAPSVLVPFADEFVPVVDLEGGRIVVAEVAGLTGPDEETGA